MLITPRAHARARGYVIGRGVYILYIIIYLQGLFSISLSDAHFSTGRLLFEFNRLQYTLAAPEVFVSSANPVILPSGYRVSIVRNTNIDQIETTPLATCTLHCPLEALGKWIYMPSWPGAWATLQDRPFSAAASVHRSTSEEKHGRLLKRGSGDCRTVSVTYDF